MVTRLKSSPEYEALQGTSKRLKTQATKLNNQAEKLDQMLQIINAQVARSDALRGQAGSLKQSQISHANESDYGRHYNLVIKGLGKLFR